MLSGICVDHPAALPGISWGAAIRTCMAGKGYTLEKTDD
jgi:hypothetical protein